MKMETMLKDLARMVKTTEYTQDLSQAEAKKLVIKELTQRTNIKKLQAKELVEKAVSNM